MSHVLVEVGAIPTTPIVDAYCGRDIRLALPTYCLVPPYFIVNQKYPTTSTKCLLSYSTPGFSPAKEENKTIKNNKAKYNNILTHVYLTTPSLRHQATVIFVSHRLSLHFNLIPPREPPSLTYFTISNIISKSSITLISFG